MKYLFIMLLTPIFARAQHNTASIHPNAMDTVTGLYKWQHDSIGIYGNVFIEKILNLEYVIVKDLFGMHRLDHVCYLTKKGKKYYYPDGFRVYLYSYKQTGQPEVIIKK